MRVTARSLASLLYLWISSARRRFAISLPHLCPSPGLVFASVFFAISCCASAARWSVAVGFLQVASAVFVAALFLATVLTQSNNNSVNPAGSQVSRTVSLLAGNVSAKPVVEDYTSHATATANCWRIHSSSNIKAVNFEVLCQHDLCLAGLGSSTVFAYVHLSARTQ